MKTGLIIMIAALALQACVVNLGRSGGKQAHTNVGMLAAADDSSAIPYYYPQAVHEGSLWIPHNSRAFLFGDNKASNINDIVTVHIFESSDASRDASTNLDKKSGMKTGISKFFGSPLDFGMSNLWGKNTGAATAAERTDRPFVPELEADSQNSFKGSGSTKRKDKMIATISAKVTNVYPNGNLFIQGMREITLNNEKQIIQLSGIVRPEDISSNNTVMSTAIADAKISVTGKGVIADKQNPGYGHRVFDIVWPF